MGWLTNRAKQDEIRAQMQHVAITQDRIEIQWIHNFVRNINAYYNISEDQAISFIKFNCNTTDANIYKHRDILELQSSLFYAASSGRHVITQNSAVLSYYTPEAWNHAQRYLVHSL
jgi:hypothetical protein